MMITSSQRMIQTLSTQALTDLYLLIILLLHKESCKL